MDPTDKDPTQSDSCWLRICNTIVQGVLWAMAGEVTTAFCTLLGICLAPSTGTFAVHSCCHIVIRAAMYKHLIFISNARWSCYSVCRLQVLLIHDRARDADCAAIYSILTNTAL
jgi:hypothetical protein